MDGLVGRVRKFVSLEMPATTTAERGGAGAADEAAGGAGGGAAGEGDGDVQPLVVDPAHQSVEADASRVAEAGAPVGAPDANEVAAESAQPVPLDVPAPEAAEGAAAPVEVAGGGLPPGDPLPDEGQRAALCQMIAAALFEIRTLAAGGKAAQAADLAAAFQGLPTGMYGWERWDRRALRGMLDGYQQQYPAEGQEQPDYVAWFDQILNTNELLAPASG